VRRKKLDPAAVIGGCEPVRFMHLDPESVVINSRYVNEQKSWKKTEIQVLRPAF